MKTDEQISPVTGLDSSDRSDRQKQTKVEDKIFRKVRYWAQSETVKKWWKVIAVCSKLNRHVEMKVAERGRPMSYPYILILTLYTFPIYCLVLPASVCFNINWFIKRHKVVTTEAPFLTRDGRNHLQYSLHLTTEGWPGWVGLSGRDKYWDGRPTEGRHQSQYWPGLT